MIFINRISNNNISLKINCTSTLVAPTVANRPISAGPSTVPLKSITLPEK